MNSGGFLCTPVKARDCNRAVTARLVGMGNNVADGGFELGQGRGDAGAWVDADGSGAPDFRLNEPSAKVLKADQERVLRSAGCAFISLQLSLRRSARLVRLALDDAHRNLHDALVAKRGSCSPCRFEKFYRRL
jgi:hypothetical protein